MIRSLIVPVAFVSVALSAGGWYISAPADAAQAPRVLTMIIAHRPYSVFDRSLSVFADELEKRSNGSLSLRVVAPSELGLPDSDVARPDVERLMRSGDVQLSTSVVSAFEDEAAGADRLDEPFAFGTYAEVASFLDGEAGRSVLKNVSDASSMEALAFTFSGGFRSIALSDGLVDRVSDIRGVRVRPTGGDASSRALEKMGAVPDASTSDAVEFTYTRVAELGSAFRFPVVLETKHGVLATMILVDDEFFSSLSAREQGALREAAQAAALVEREDSITLAEQTRAALSESGVSIIEVSDEERTSLRQ